MKKYNVVINGKSFEVEILDIESGEAKVTVNGVEINADIHENKKFEISDENNKFHVLDKDNEDNIVEEDIQEKSFVPTSHPESVDSDGTIKAMMPGKIINVIVSIGDQVKQGDLVCVMESMKMEQNILADIDGEVLEVNVKPGDSVEHSAVLIKLG